MKKTTFLILITLLVHLNCLGQKSDSSSVKKWENFINIGAGGSYSAVLDEGISPLLYRGIGGAGLISTRDESAKLLIQTLTRFDFNVVEASESGRQMYAYRFEETLELYMKKWRLVKTPLTIDPGLGVQYKWLLRSHQSYTNNSQHLENKLSFYVGAHSQYDFKLFNRDFEIGNFLRLPLLSYVVRPIYAGAQSPGTLGKEEPSFFDYLKGGNIYTWGKYFEMDLQTYLNYNFKDSPNGISLSYFWTFESLNTVNPSKEGQHALVFSLNVKL